MQSFKKVKVKVIKNHISFLSLLVLLLLSNQTQAQTTLSDELRADKAKQELEDKGIAEDQVKAKLKEKGIDLDNLRPEQLPTLEDDIKSVVRALEKEKNDTATAFNDATTSLKEGVDSVVAKEVKEEVGDNAAEVIEDMDEGASLEEALANDLTKKLSKKYRAKTNIFGHHIFFDKSIDLYRTTSSRSTTPNSYVLDVGDKIAINIFGASQADLLYEIEEDGFIRPSGMYKIYMKGITIAKAKVMLKNRFRQAFMFSDGQFNVDLHTARTITVNLFGEVNQPGSYTISALNTGLNAIIAAGGITPEASVRSIRIVSAGKERILDVYDYLANPQILYDYYLYDNDIIYVSKWSKLVSANGNGFKTNGRFELLEDEGVNDLLTYTQGVKSKAYTSVVQYMTYDGEVQMLKNYSLDQLKSGVVSLQDGDVITISTSLVAYENYVQVNGAVRHPGKYEFTEGQRVSDVLKLAYLEEETFSQLAYLTRKNTDGTLKLIRLYIDEILANPFSAEDIMLQKEDFISLYGKSSFIDKYSFNIEGAVRTPSQYFYDPEDNITVYDAVMMSKGLRTNATGFGYIIGAPINNSLEKNYTVINLDAIMKDPSGEENVKIKAKDRIVVPAQEQYMDQFKVSISGAVRKPGEYVYDSSLSVKDMLVMAGGIKLEAAANRVDVFRLEIDENERTRTFATSIVLNRELEPFNDNDTLVIRPYDKIVVRYAPEFEPMQMVQINGEVRFPGAYALTGENEPLSSLVARAGGFTNESLPEASIMVRSEDNIGKIVTRLDKAVKGCKRFDITLKGGDAITVPKFIDIILLDKTGTNAEDVYLDKTLEGSNTLNIAVNYQPRRAGYYVRKYGGGFNRKEASKGKTTVQHPNGRVKRTFNILGFIHIYPRVRRGSQIKLELKPKAKRIRTEKAERERVREGDGDAPKEEKEKLSLTERLMQMQAFASVSAAITGTVASTVLIIRELSK